MAEEVASSIPPDEVASNILPNEVASSIPPNEVASSVPPKDAQQQRKARFQFPKLCGNFKKDFRMLGLIMWKNLLLRMRQWGATFFEVFFPLLGGYFIAFLLIPQRPPIPTYGVWQPPIEFGELTSFQDIYVPPPRGCTKPIVKDPPEPSPADADFLVYAPIYDDQKTNDFITNLLKETGCPKVEGISDAKALESEYRTNWKKNSQNFKGAIIFPSQKPDEWPSLKKFPITLRFPPSCLPSTNHLFPQPGDPHYHFVGPNLNNLLNYQQCNVLAMQWFLQDMVTRSVLNVKEQSPVALQAMPYPDYLYVPDVKMNPSTSMRVFLLCLVVMFCTCFILVAVTRNVVAEKNSGISELLRSTGVSKALQWVGWLFHVLLPHIFITIPGLMIITLAMHFQQHERPMFNADPSLVMIVLFLFVLSNCAMGFLICACIKKPIMASTVAVVLTLSSTFMGMYYGFPKTAGYRTLSYPVRLIAAICFPNFALAAIFLNFCFQDYVVTDDTDVRGSRWSNLLEWDFGAGDNISNGSLMLIMLLDSIFWFLLATYLDGVLPSEFGVRRPWTYFECSKGKRKSTISPAVTDMEAASSVPSAEVSAAEVAVKESETPKQSDSQTSKPEKTSKTSEESKKKKENGEEVVATSPFETKRDEGSVGVEVCDLVKRFRNKIAVNGVSLKMYTGDIFALLGHNGAGKTTLISMLTGFFQPDSGTAFIDGYDISKNLDQARNSLGLCPQHNVIFEFLTVKNHLLLFGMLRGQTRKQAKNEAQKLMIAMHFSEKANVLAKKLSGGQKRKLCMAIALIGNTKVVVLDEPTSGMDPQARREIWDLLLKLRGGRTILLTTHFMEEADVLGDRIGIMASGELRCCGSPTFLKKFYGTGYSLKLTLTEPAITAVPSQMATESTQEVEIPSTTPSKLDQLEGPQQGQSIQLFSSPSQQTYTMRPSPRAIAILAVVQKHVPNASIKTDIRVEQTSNDMVLNLPGDTATTQVLNQLFATLTSQQEKLGIKGMGLAQTTMDEVFVRVGEVAETSSPHQKSDLPEDTMQKAPKERTRCVTQFMSLFMKNVLYAYYRWAVIVFALLLVLLFFLAAMLAANLMLGNIRKPSKDQTPTEENRDFKDRRSAIIPQTRSASPSKGTSHKDLPYTLDGYDSPVTLYSGDNSELKKIIGASAKKVDNVDEELREIGDSDRVEYKKKYPVAIVQTTNKVVAKFNLHPYHAAPVALNLAFNIYLAMKESKVRFEVHQHSFDGEAGFHKFSESAHSQEKPEPGNGDGDGKKRFVRSVPLGNPDNATDTRTLSSDSTSGVKSRADDDDKTVIEQAFENADFWDDPYYRKCIRWKNGTELVTDYPGSVGSVMQTVISMSLILFLSYFVVQPIEENLMKVKQLQSMTGVSPFVYWAASFAFDYSLYCLMVVVMLCILILGDTAWGYNVFTANGAWAVVLIILLTYGFTAIIFCYLVSLRSSTVVGAYTLVAVFQLFGGLMLALVFDPQSIEIISGSGFTYPLYFLHYLGRLFPSCSVSRAIWYWAEISASNSRCRLLEVPSEMVTCPAELPYWVYSTERSLWRYSNGAVRYNMKFCASPEKDTESYRYDGSETSKYAPGILQELLIVVIHGLIYLFWLLIIEFKVCRKCGRAELEKQLGGAFPLNINDEDVWDEAARVDEVLGTGQTNQEALIVQQLCKSFDGSFAAVSNLQFGVHYGECFGLLGVNGAGKTTAFRMITGDEIPSRGNVYGFGTNLNQNLTKFLSHIGYCPQFDAIFGDFTGSQMLQLFAGLRGVSFKERKNQAMLWLRRMGLTDSANVSCGRYSGGMKRRLSTAMAMIGDPDVILLDEPTSGVDPVSRRQFWKILDKLRASGQSIILTSHSMEECEALCARLGIIVNGQFQCFGGVQHLKSKFAQGYSLTVKLKQDLDFDAPEIDEKIKEFEQKIQEKFQPCELKDKHQNLLQFHLQDVSITWDILFKTMEEVRSDYEAIIEDYSVNETSLEEVFLAFARMQYPERKVTTTMCRRICTCRC